MKSERSLNLILAVLKLQQKGIAEEQLENLTEEDLKECLDFSNAFCAVSVQGYGAIQSYPSAL